MARSGGVRRRIRRIGLVALIAGLGYVLLGIPLFVVPPQDPVPEHVDVVVVLGPADYRRIRLARQLVADGVSTTVLLSIPQQARVVDSREYRRFDPICSATPGLICQVAHPHTTEGEALMLRDEAAVHGWRSAIVITQRAHLLRAKMIVGRCFTGTIVMRQSIEPPIGGWPYEYAYQTLATVKAWLHPAC